MFEDYLKSDKAVNAVYTAIKEEFGFEANEYAPSKGNLGIVPRGKDHVKFKNDFTADERWSGIKCFKVRSEIGKAWKAKIKDVEIIRKPVISWYLDGLAGGSSRSRLFIIDDVMYGSLERDNDFEVNHPDFEEIKASEFHRVIEEYQAREEK